VLRSLSVYSYKFMYSRYTNKIRRNHSSVITLCSENNCVKQISIKIFIYLSSKTESNHEGFLSFEILFFSNYAGALAARGPVCARVYTRVY